MKRAIIFLISLLFLLVSEHTFAQTVNIPLNKSSWDYWTEDGSSLNWEETSEGLKFYGVAYRDGSNIWAKKSADYSNATVYFKWKVDGASHYMAIGVKIGFYDGNVPKNVVRGPTYTTDHSYNGSKLISHNTWYYTRFDISSPNFTEVTATGNYDDMGGTVFNTYQGVISNEGLTYISNSNMMAGFGDNYGGTSAYMVVGEAKYINTECFTQTDINAAYQQGYQAGLAAAGGGSSGECASLKYDLFDILVHVPCLDLDGATYWFDMKIIGTDPKIIFELTDIGPN